MPRAIVLHAGFHKTGTSTIQAFLRRNRKVLMPHMAIRLKGQMQDLIHATRGYSSYGDPFSLDKVERRFSALLDGLPGMPRRVLCLSAEELSGHMPGRDPLEDYRAAPILLDLMVRQVQSRFPQADVAVLLGTRASDSWLRSAWGEHVKSSSLTLDLAQYCTRFGAAADLTGMAGQVAARVPCPVHVKPIETCADLPLGPVTPLLDLCAVPQAVQDGLTPEPAQNTALDPAMLDALLHINRSVTDPKARLAAKAALLAKAPSR